MTIVITNLWILPVMFVIWAIDSIIFLVLLRLTVARIIAAGKFRTSLHDLTEPILGLIAGSQPVGFSRPIRQWEARAIAITGLLLARYVLVALVLAMN